MREAPFIISGVARIDGDQVTIIVNRSETTVTLEPEVTPGKRISLEPGKIMFDVIVEAAQVVVQRKGFNRFSASEVYHEALEKYPELKRNSFMSRFIACTPDHPSYKHYASNRDFFSRIGPGLYRLNDEYLLDKTVDKEDILKHS